MSASPTSVADTRVARERRRRSRYFVGLPVRVHIDGMDQATLAELTDVSATGCYLSNQEISFLIALGDRVAFGFVLPSRRVGLVRGRVVRRTPGQGLAVAIEQANEPFDELLGTLAQNRPRLAASRQSADKP
jgi:PilZ domain